MKKWMMDIRCWIRVARRNASLFKWFVCFAAANLYCLTSAVELHSAFENTSDGARVTSMGTAFTALSDDVNAVKTNPAGLAQISATELTASYEKLHLGLSDQSDIASSFFAVAQPIWKWHIGTFGVGYDHSNLAGFYEEDSIYISFAKNLSDSLLSGISVKRLHRSAEPDIYTAQDPLFRRYGLSASALGFDFGLIYKFWESFSLGFTAKDFNRPDIGLASEDRIPVEYRWGAAYRQKTADYTLDLGKKSDVFDYSVGIEKWLMTRYAFRGGFNFDTSNKRNVSLGVGYKRNALELDYSFLMPLAGIKGTAGSHQFSLLLRFDLHAAQLQQINENEVKMQIEQSSKTVKMFLEEIEQLRKELSAKVQPSSFSVQDSAGTLTGRESFERATSPAPVGTFSKEIYPERHEKGLPFGFVSTAAILAPIISIPALLTPPATAQLLVPATIQFLAPAAIHPVYLKRQNNVPFKKINKLNPILRTIPIPENIISAGELESQGATERIKYIKLLGMAVMVGQMMILFFYFFVK